MKALIFLFGLLLLNSRCDASNNTTDASSTLTATQTTTIKTTLNTTTTDPTVGTPDTNNSTEEETTEGSGGPPTVPTTSPTTKSPLCAENPCGKNGDCIPGTKEGEVTCKCYDGWSGEKCEVQECKSESILVENKNVDQPCNTSVANYNITAKFEQTPIGTTAYADATCSDGCTDNKDRSIASRKCGANGKWEDPQYRNCAEKTDDVSDALEDYNPDDATTEEVTQTIDVIKEASEQEDIPTEDADNILAVTNEVLATNSAAASSVEDKSKEILDSMDDLANNIVLEENTADGYSEYSEEDSNIALAVVALNPDPTARAFTGDFYYGTDSEWGEELNLAASDLQLTKTELKGSYISAVPASESVRISYKFYSDGETLFPKIAESVTKGIVYSAAGNIGGTYTFKFELTNDTLTKDDIMCARWDRDATGWNEESECTDYSVTGSFGFCVCSEDGEYTMRFQESNVVDNGDGGGEPLSAGAIAGIVVGSVVGVALIGGGVYYFAFYKKKNKKVTKVEPAKSDVEMTRGNDNHAESSDDD